MKVLAIIVLSMLSMNIQSLCVWRSARLLMAPRMRPLPCRLSNRMPAIRLLPRLAILPTRHFSSHHRKATDKTGNVYSKRLIGSSCSPVVKIESQTSAAAVLAQAAMPAKEIPTVLPSAHVLRTRLAALGLAHFAKKTRIHMKLGSQEKYAIGVVTAVELALYDYDQNLKQNAMAYLMQRKKSEIIRCILQDSPASIQELEKLRLL